MPLPSESPPSEESPGHATTARLDFKSLGETDVEPAREQLFDLASKRQGRDLRIDLGRVEFLSSTGLGLFVTLNREVKAAGGRLSLCNVRGPVYEVFAVTRLTSILDVSRRQEDGEPAGTASP